MNQGMGDYFGPDIPFSRLHQKVIHFDLPTQQPSAFFLLLGAGQVEKSPAVSIHGSV